MRELDRRSAGRRYVSAAVVVAAVTVAACSSSGGRHVDGVAFSQRIREPTLSAPSTEGHRIALRSACGHRECVLAFVALDDAEAVGFLRRLARVDSSVRPRPVVIAATIDPAHDTLSRLGRTLSGLGTVGIRATYAMTEPAARSVLIDVEPPAAGPVPTGEPQAVVFRSDGTAAVGWPLSLGASGMRNDLLAAS